MKNLIDRQKSPIATLLCAATLALWLPVAAHAIDNIDVNSPPVFTSLDDVGIGVGRQLRFVVAPSDADGDVPGVYIRNKPASISFEDNLDGSRTFDWRPMQSGDLELTFIATDAQDESITTSKSIVITVAPDSNNQTPYFESLAAVSLLLGETLSTRIAPLDANGTVPGVHLEKLPDNASLNDNLDGSRTFSWTPGEFDLGITIFTFIATDAEDAGLRATQTLQVTVNELAGHDSQPLVVEPSGHSIVLDSSIPSSGTTDTSLFNASGQILDIGGQGLPAKVEWVNQDLTGNEIDNGSIPVADDGSWAGNVILSEGHNELLFSTPEADELAAVDIIYNRAYRFGGQLDLQPDVAYLNEAREFLVRVALTDERTEHGIVTLVSVANGEVVAVLTDDGDSDNGDEIDSDDVYSALFTLDEASAGTREYQVRVNLDSGVEASSESASILVTEHLDAIEVTELLEQQGELQQRIENINEENLANEIEDILSELESDPAIAQAGVSDGGQGLWMVYSNGIAGVLYTPKEGSKGGAPGGSTEGATLKAITKGAQLDIYSAGNSIDYSAPLPYSRYCSNKTSGSFRTKLVDTKSAAANQIKSTKALAIAAQYFDWGENDDIPQMQQLLADNGCFDVTYKKYTSSGSGTVEDFKNLGDYGVIMISSHGESFYSSALDSLVDQYGWEGPPGQVIFHSNMLVTADNRVTYEDDLQTGRLVLWGNHYGIMPSFISRYSGTLPDSLVYMSICKGTWNSSLAQAFLGNGAETFLGYDDYVTVPFCELTGPSMLESLLHDGNTLEDAFNAGQVDPYGTDEALFKLFGATDLEFDPSSLQDTGFESGSLTQAWAVSGDARTLTSLGSALPTEGNNFSIISTGLSLPINTATLTQTFCLCEGASSVSFDWNFFSEEFPQSVGTDYQDSFSAVIIDIDDPENTYTMVEEAINSLASTVSPVANAFDRGDVHATGWRGFTGNIPAQLQGKKVMLKFETEDVGDSNFDTAVLIDNINLVCQQN